MLSKLSDACSIRYDRSRAYVMRGPALPFPGTCLWTETAFTSWEWEDCCSWDRDWGWDWDCDLNP